MALPARPRLRILYWPTWITPARRPRPRLALYRGPDIQVDAPFAWLPLPRWVNPVYRRRTLLHLKARGLSDAARGLALCAAVLGLTLLAAACSPYTEGPAGRVVDKSQDWAPETKTYKYFLTVRTEQGTHARFRVPSHNYATCMRGSAYPRCTHKD